MPPKSLSAIPGPGNRKLAPRSRPRTPEDLALELREQCAAVLRRVLIGGPMKRALRWLGYSPKSAYLYDQVHGDERSGLEIVCIETDAALIDPTKPRGEALAMVSFLMNRYLSPDEIQDEATRRSIDDAAIESAAANAEAGRIAHRAMTDNTIDDQEMSDYATAADRRDRWDTKQDALVHAAWERSKREEAS